MKIRKPSLMLTLSVAAVLSLVGGATLVAKNTRVERAELPLASPPTSAFARTIGAEGLVEPRSEDIAIAPTVPGLVVAVRVKAQQLVRAGDLLWEQDDRDLKAQIPVREAEIANARAAVAVAEAALSDAGVQLTMIERVADPRAIRQEDLQRRRIAVDAARAQVSASRAAFARAEAALEHTRTELALLSVIAPIDGEILKVDVRPGEYASVPARAPLVVMGDTSTMHVRVDIAEEDAARFVPASAAYASPRGDATSRIPLEFVRLEPRLVPKRNLSGDTAERVDTRVLQAIYRVTGGPSVYDGELLDVFINAPAVEPESAAEGATVQSARDALAGA
jgi:multidrug efflux pump subunit AcrA (membrane-fusion protein)